METKYTVTTPGKRIHSHANCGLDVEGYTGEKDQPGDKGCSELMLADSTKNWDIYPKFIRYHHDNKKSGDKKHSPGWLFQFELHSTSLNLTGGLGHRFRPWLL